MGELELTLYVGGVSTPPIYRGSYRGNRWIGFPPIAPRIWGGGRDGGTVGASLSERGRGGEQRVCVRSAVVLLRLRTASETASSPQCSAEWSGCCSPLRPVLNKAEE